MSSKRTSTTDAGSSGDQPPAAKKSMTQFEPVRLGSVSTLEEMDIKVLKFQNKKLAERLDQRLRAEGELRLRIEQLEKRQMQDDAVLCIVNRYWNQLNEDVRVLLQRFDAETTDEFESRNENEATTSFLMQLSTWDKQELEEKLAQRVQVSQRAVAKILQAFDRLVQRNEKITMALKGEVSDTEDNMSLDDAVKEANSALQTENRNLHSLVTSLHEKHHIISLQLAELQEQVTAMETGNAELKNRVEDLEYDVDKTRRREEKLDRHLNEALFKLKGFEARAETSIGASNSDGDGKAHSHAPIVGTASFSSMTTTPLPAVAHRKLEELQRDLEEEKELSTNRMMELEKLHQEHKDALKEVEKLKMDIQQLPESVIVETTEYKCLQSQFSVLYNESMQLKTQLEESRNFLQASKNAHLRQIEQMESEELMVQKKLRNEVIQLEDSLSQVRKEYEMLRIEFEQNLAANEQTGPINREMRHLITSLQNHNQQLKIEISRFKRKLKEANGEVIKLKSEHSANHSSSSGDANAKEEPSSSTTIHGYHGCGPSSSSSSSKSSGGGDDSLFKREREEEAEEEREREKGKSDADIIRDLKTQLKKSQEAQREMKLLLDMYKGVAKEQRDKVQLMAAEKKARSEMDELRQQLKRVQESERKERRKLADEDAVRKIKQLEDVIQQLQRNVAAQKQEEEALLNEMEVTGQAYEDMQEQNIRLIQQLREKDDANFKLMSERIKSNQIHKLLREEKDVLGEQVSTLHTQVEAQNAVVRRLEEKERILQNNLSTVEKELSLRQQAMEMHKRKAIESTQSAADLKLHLEKYHSQLKEAQLAVAEKTCSLEHESFKIKRLQEEIAGLRKKIERAKKFELASTADEVLMEEIREYKEQLTCPSCKVKRKDAVLTKCFHVFCFDCLKTRYETRQRKCPKCNAAFGANDFHRLYLS